MLTNGLQLYNFHYDYIAAAVETWRILMPMITIMIRI